MSLPYDFNDIKLLNHNTNWQSSGLWIVIYLSEMFLDKKRPIQYKFALWLYSQIAVS